MSKRATATPFPFAMWAPLNLTATATNASMRAFTSMATIAFTSQQVIWLRLTKIASEGITTANQVEMQRMVAEKVSAMTESASQLSTASTSMLSLFPAALTNPKAARRLATKSAVATDRALKPYSRRVKANARRLGGVAS